MFLFIIYNHLLPWIDFEDLNLDNSDIFLYIYMFEKSSFFLYFNHIKISKTYIKPSLYSKLVEENY